MGIPIARWFIRESPKITWMIKGSHYFRKPPCLLLILYPSDIWMKTSICNASPWAHLHGQISKCRTVGHNEIMCSPIDLIRCDAWECKQRFKRKRECYYRSSIDPLRVASTKYIYIYTCSCMYVYIYIYILSTVCFFYGCMCSVSDYMALLAPSNEHSRILLMVAALYVWFSNDQFFHGWLPIQPTLHLFPIPSHYEPRNISPSHPIILVGW